MLVACERQHLVQVSGSPRSRQDSLLALWVHTALRSPLLAGLRQGLEPKADLLQTVPLRRDL